MKTLDLNIKLKTPVKGEDEKTDLKGREVAVRWIGLMIERSLNKPDIRTGRPTVAVNMDTQRKYFKVITKLEDAKDGIVKLEDDDFTFMDRKFHQAEIPVQKESTEILMSIEDAINKAKTEGKK